MYSRGTRLLTRPAQSTAPGVGPGTYRVDDGRHRGESYAPFQSMAARESFLTVDSQLVAAPGPAHYTPTLEAHIHVKGGDSLQSKARRFDELRQRAPGPGTYSVSKRSDWLRKTYPPPSDRDELLQSAGVFRSGRLMFTRKATAPSVPTPGKSYGYDETGDGNLTPQPLPPHDATMGPAYYAVSHDSTATTTKYKGVHFGNLQSLRTQFKGREGPGPGDYQLSTAAEEDEQPGQPTSASHSESLPRYHILVTRQEEKKAVPGPGKYEIQSQFKSGQSVDGAAQNDDDDDDDEDEDAQSRAPFGSRQQRFISPKYHSPACTAYQDPRSALSQSGTGAGGGRAPFGQTALRFRSNRLAREIPGPGTYNNSQMTSLAADLSKKSQFHGTYKCPFGSTAVRTAPLVKRDEMLLPGPAHYQRRPHSGKGDSTDGERKRGGQQTKSQRSSYAFASTTSRLYSPPSIVTDIPPPGSYEVSESYARSQDRAQSSIGRRSVKGAFLSSSSRSAPPRDILLEEPDECNPGPGEYECKDTLGKSKPGLLCHRDGRFKPIDSRVPGPGAYTLSKTYKDTVLHGTFNATLNNPLTETDQQSPQGTVKKHSLVVET